MKKIKLLSTVCIATLLASTNAKADQIDSEKFVYAGLELGISEPVKHSFKHKKTKFRLEKSKMFGAKVGYGFYPNMMLEISGTHQPRYKFSYVLPAFNFALPTPLGNMNISVPKTPGKTTAISNVFTLNLIYQLESLKFAEIKPYIIGGAGMAFVHLKPTMSKLSIDAPVIGNITKDFFKLDRSKTNALAYQAGVGLSRSIGDRVEVDLSAKLQIVQNVKIKYSTLDISTGKFVSQKPIKQTIGVGEFALGIIFKQPV